MLKKQAVNSDNFSLIFKNGNYYQVHESLKFARI